MPDLFPSRGAQNLFIIWVFGAGKKMQQSVPQSTVSSQKKRSSSSQNLVCLPKNQLPSFLCHLSQLRQVRQLRYSATQLRRKARLCLLKATFYFSRRLWDGAPESKMGLLPGAGPSVYSSLLGAGFFVISLHLFMVSFCSTLGVSPLSTSLRRPQWPVF